MSTGTSTVGSPAAEANPIQGGWTPRLVVLMVLLVLPSELAFLAFAYPSNALPAIAAEFQTDQVAWLQTIFALFAAVSAALTGKLADRFGKRRMVLAVLALITLGLLISAAAPNFGILLVGRALQGTSLSLPFLIPSLIRDIFPARTVPLAVSLAATGSGALSIATTLVVGDIITHLGFRATFWLPAVAGAVIIGLIYAAVPESPVRAKVKSLDLPGAVLLGAGVTGVLLAVSLGSTWGWTSGRTSFSFVAGVVLLVAWIAHSRRTEEPLIDLRILTSFPLLMTVGLAAVAIGAPSFFYVLTPMIARNPGPDWGLGLSADGQSNLATIFTVGTFLAGFVVGRALTRVSAPLVAVGVLATMSIGYVVAMIGLETPVVFALASLLIGGMSGAGYAIALNLVVVIAPQDKQATTGAVVVLAGNMFAAVMPVVIYAVMNSMASTMPGVPGPVYPRNAVVLATLIPAAAGVVGMLFAVALVVYQRRGNTLRAEAAV